MATQDEQRRPLPNQPHPLEQEMTPQQRIERLQEEHEVQRQQLKEKQKENQQLKEDKCALHRTLEQQGKDLERPCQCTRSDCQQAQRDLKGLKHDLSSMYQVACRRPECVSAHRRVSELEWEKAHFHRLNAAAQSCTRTDCQLAKQELEGLRQDLRVPCRRSDCAGARQNLEREKRKLQSENSQWQSAAQQTSATVKSLQKKKSDSDALQVQVKQLQQELSSAKETKDKLQKVTKERDELRGHLQRAKVQIKQMENSACSSLRCSNEHAKRMVSVLGDKLRDGSREVTVTETLHHLDRKLEKLLENHSKQTGSSYAATVQGGHSLEELKCKLESLQRENDACARKRDGLQRKVDELTSQLYGTKCQRPECVKLRQDLRQKQVAEIGQAGSIGKDMGKITGGDYGKLIQRFEDLTTSPDGLLGELEEVMEPFQAKRLVSKIFKWAYNRSRVTVTEAIQERLETLFVVNKSAPKEEMEDVSRGYGRLLYGSGLKANQAAYVDELTQQIRRDLEGPKSTQRSTFHQIFQKQPSILGEIVKLAWEMVTLPNPMIILEPGTIAEQTHEREFGYWDPSNTSTQLIYLRPVVYRSYQGDIACKAWVANSETKVPFQPPTSNPDQNPQAGAGEGGGILGWFGLT